MTLFGVAALRLWLELEADPMVRQLCERPVLIPDVRPPCTVDFWVERGDRQDFLLVRRPESAQLRVEALEAFKAWASSQGCGVQEVVLAPDTVGRARWRTAWVQILQYINAHSEQVPPGLVRRAEHEATSTRSIGDLCQIIAYHPGVLVRTAAYLLVYRGTHRLVDLAEHGLSDATLLEPL
ncbi:hypothetical protein AAW51_2740 [Caldimonas brevitalea]|uniref:Uncharacterized protein n=2 Tax=Caldimonas brevitalea TaxID=413882 RepID=A0A0G3BQ05_9BURK|nr:hypothetical protein AAW51_2740 [Caldimonas brevitalea]